MATCCTTNASDEARLVRDIGVHSRSVNGMENILQYNVREQLSTHLCRCFLFNEPV